MPFSTVAEFRTSVKSWSKRTELTDAEINDFILLFEAEFFAEARLRAMETVDAAFVVSSELTALPTGFKELRSIKSSSSPSYALELATPQYISDRFQDGQTGYPVFYVIEGDNLRVAPAPDGSYTFRIDYYKALTTISAGTVNWLLTNHPGVYLFGTLRHIPDYTGDHELAKWDARYAAAKAVLLREDAMSRRGGSQPAMRVRNVF